MADLIQCDFDLVAHNSWRISSVAEFFCEPTSETELLTALSWAKNKGISVSVLGGGTNTLVSDEGAEGLVVSTRRMDELSVHRGEEKLEIHCQSGVLKSDLLKIFLKDKLAPALFLCGLPGDVGGGVVMNAGVSESIDPREFGEIVEEFSVIDFHHLEKKVFKHEDIGWRYRKSEGWKPGVIISAKLSWPMSPDENLPQKVRDSTRRRITKQPPLSQPSCGSTFRNPLPEKAGALIEKAGLKGYIIGGAQFSTKHANFIITQPGAKAADVHQLIEKAKKEVRDQFGISLEAEVAYFGNWSML